jgi:hypothetical protein
MAYAKFKLEHIINIFNNSYLLIPFLTLETQKLPYKSSAGRLVAKVLLSMEEPVIETY